MTVPRSASYMPLLVLALAMSLIAPAMQAYAAETGRCDTPENMTALLKAEGQRSLAHGNQADTGNGLIFTADPAGKAGYILSADKPVSERASRICIADRFEGVTIHDARRPGIPPGALSNADPQAAARRCQHLAATARIAPDSCGWLDAMLRKVEPLGERVMLIGKSQGMIVVVTGNLTATDRRAGRGAVLYGWMPEGAAMIGLVFTGSAYTETALQTLR